MAEEPSVVTEADLVPLLQLLNALNSGDFAQQLPEGAPGTLGEIAVSFNALVDRLNAFAHDLTFWARETGVVGTLGQRVQVPGAEGTWKDLQDNVNFFSDNLTDRLRQVADVTHSYAEGDFTPRATLPCRGELGELMASLNRLGEQLQRR